MVRFINGAESEWKTLLEAYLDYRGQIEPGAWTAEALYEHWQKQPMCFVGRVYRQELQSLVCFQSLSQVVEILYLETLPRWRQLKSMESLLHWIFSQYPTKSFWLDVSESNLPALQLYLKLGFQQVGLRPAYYPDGCAALLLERLPDGDQVGA